MAALEYEYADFALWEHSRGHDEAALSWWVSQLGGAPECISLPQDRPRPKEQATAGSRADVHFDRGIIARAIAICASANATMNSTVLALWSVMLLHLSQADLVVGLPHSMRYCLTNSHSSQPCLHQWYLFTRAQALRRIDTHCWHVHQYAAIAATCLRVNRGCR